MPAPKVLLANESGIGRGHIVKLASLARALGPGLPLVAGLGRRKHADELQVLGAQILAAPALGYSAEARDNPALEGNASWGDYLAAMGLAREDQLRRSLAWWTQTIVSEDISILVADYSPLAMLAAQGLKAQGWAIEIISTGTGYGVPPADMPVFPQLLPDYSHVVHPEADLLGLINRVAADFAIEPLPALPALYRADLALPSTMPFLDPYRASRDPTDLLPPQVEHSDGLANTGDEVFIYFSTRELDDPAVVRAVANLPLPRRAFMPGATPEITAQLAKAGVIVEHRPISIAEITSRSRLILHSAQHGILCLAALAGLPQVGLPQHLEHLFHGRRAGQQGILDLLTWKDSTEASITDMVLSVYHDRAMQKRAQDFALQLRSTAPKDPQAILKARLAPAIARAVQAVR